MKTKIIILSFLLSLMACSEKENSKSNSNEIDLEGAIENAENRRAADPNASGGNKCLMEFQTKYDQLLSENDILKATGFSKEVMETKNNNLLKNPEYHEFVYKFKNNRKGKLPGFDQEMQLPDVVAVRSIKPMSLAQFEKTYKAITDEEMQVAKDALNDAAEGNSGDAQTDAAMEKVKDQNISEQQVKETSGVLLDTFKEVSKGYRKVENLGDTSVWNVVTNELIVLQNGVKFEVRTDLSNDPEMNKSVAIVLAEIILNKCK